MFVAVRGLCCSCYLVLLTSADIWGPLPLMPESAAVNCSCYVLLLTSVDLSGHLLMFAAIAYSLCLRLFHPRCELLESSAAFKPFLRPCCVVRLVAFALLCFSMTTRPACGLLCQIVKVDTPDKADKSACYLMRWPGGWKLQNGTITKFNTVSRPPVLLVSPVQLFKSAWYVRTCQKHISEEWSVDEWCPGNIDVSPMQHH